MLNQTEVSFYIVKGVWVGENQLTIETLGVGGRSQMSFGQGKVDVYRNLQCVAPICLEKISISVAFEEGQDLHQDDRA